MWEILFDGSAPRWVGSGGTPRGVGIGNPQGGIQKGVVMGKRTPRGWFWVQWGWGHGGGEVSRNRKWQALASDAELNPEGSADSLVCIGRAF